MVHVTDPNFPINDGDHRFPINVVRDSSVLKIGDRSVPAKETMVIRDEDHFRELFDKWQETSE